MEKPRCRVCLARHWGNEAHQFADSVTELDEAVSEGVAVSEPVAAAKDGVGQAGDERKVEPVTLRGQVARNQRWRDSHRKEYNAYMREYMRRYRVHRNQ